MGVEDPVGREAIVEEGVLAGLAGPVHMGDTVEVEDPVAKVEAVHTGGIAEAEDQAGMVRIMAAMEGITTGGEAIGGIMEGMADIMVVMAGSFPDYLSAVP